MNKEKMSKAHKRKLQQKQKKEKTRKIILMSVFLLTIISIITYFALTMGSNDDIVENNPVSTDVIETESQILIPLSNIDYDAKFFSYMSDGVDIKYLIVVGGDGNYHTAFDACDVCYDAKKGYTQDNDVVRCINCGLTFAINDLGEKNTGGGCWPSYLPFQLENENLVIEKSDLEDKKFMFA
jgi:uncharacterized membrane protein